MKVVAQNRAKVNVKVTFCICRWACAVPPVIVTSSIATSKWQIDLLCIDMSLSSRKCKIRLQNGRKPKDFELNFVCCTPKKKRKKTTTTQLKLQNQFCWAENCNRRGKKKEKSCHQKHNTRSKPITNQLGNVMPDHLIWREEKTSRNTHSFSFSRYVNQIVILCGIKHYSLTLDSFSFYISHKSCCHLKCILCLLAKGFVYCSFSVFLPLSLWNVVDFVSFWLWVSLVAVWVVH